MKKLSFLTFLFINSISFYSCKKATVTTPAFTATESHWTYSGHTYVAATAFFSTAQFTAPDTIGDFVTIIFLNKPTTNGTYTFTSNIPPSASQCNMSIYDNSTTAFIQAITGNVNVTVTGGHVTAIFTNIKGINGITNDTTIVSGTIVEYP
jgi:hypothetical protein